jgi:hypothetical protein
MTTIVKALYGHTSFETAFCAEDYPYGRLRTKMYFWLETKDSKGVRLSYRSLNPKTGSVNKQHNEGYAEISANLYLDENGHCKLASLNQYADFAKVSEFIQNFPENHRMSLIKVVCLKKYTYYRQCVDQKRTFISINGVEEPVSGDELEKLTKDKNGWWQAYLLAAGKPSDTAEPELKKKD